MLICIISSTIYILLSHFNCNITVNPLWLSQDAAHLEHPQIADVHHDFSIWPLWHLPSGADAS